jgi:general nucleoside transport system permease protein
MSDEHPENGDERPSTDPERHGSGGDGRAPVLEADENGQAEIEEARERERETTTVDLGASVGQRFRAAVTGAGLVITLLSIVSALVIGAMIIALSDDATRESLGYFTARPSDTFANGWAIISGAYSAMFRGAFAGTGPLSETLVAATPLILTGLAVAVPLRTGLFNIGGEGQMVVGGTVAGFLGFALVGLPMIVHLPLALLAGAVAGGLYGWIPGILKARTGAHEVISTIMLNNIALLTLAWVLTTELFRRPDRLDPISRPVQDSALLPQFTPTLRVNVGLIVALLLAVAIFWMMERSTTGFELNAVGLNPHAARTAGMNPGRSIVTAMSTGGLLAGAAGAAVVLGVQGRITDGFSAGLGFEGITVALLGRGGVGGTVAAGLLFGSMRSGGRLMQAETGIALDLVLVLQGLIIVFIAAPGLVRAIFRIRAAGAGSGQITKGWGS